MRVLIAAVLILLSTLVAGADQPMPADVTVCFTPGQDCAGRIALAIDDARSEIKMQAYGLTSTAILTALRRALDRGVKVEAILDETNEQKRYGAARYLMLAGADVWIDDKVAIAHNKVIIVDDGVVIGGSFNFTKSAQDRNAENVTFIRSQAVAARFTANWRARLTVSRPYDVGVRRPQ